MEHMVDQIELMLSSFFTAQRMVPPANSFGARFRMFHRVVNGLMHGKYQG